MKPYKNVSGNSGIRAYEYGQEYIDVQFVSGQVYRYTCRSAGPENVAHMKVLADSGRGLSSFISRVVRDAMNG